MRCRLEYPSGALINIEPDPANPAAILTTMADGTRPRSFLLSVDECGKLARALADYVPAEEPGVRPCPVCDHDQRYTDEMIRALGAARKHVEADLFALLQSHCRLDETGAPRPETLDESAAEPVAAAERLIRQIDAALGIEP